MFDFKVIKKVEIPPISEDVLKQMLIECIAKKLPVDVQVNDVTFAVKRKPSGIELEVDAQFIEGDSSKEAPKVKSEPIELPKADDVLDLSGETELTPDGVPEIEKDQLSLIDEVLAEEDEALNQEEEVPAPGKSLAQLFDGA